MQTLSVSCSFSNTNTHRFHCDLAQPGICKPCQSVVYLEAQIRIDSTAVKHTLEYANLVSQSVVHPVCEIFFLFFPFRSFAISFCFVDLSSSFVGLAKTHGTGREGFYFSKLFFFFKLQKFDKNAGGGEHR